MKQNSILKTVHSGIFTSSTKLFAPKSLFQHQVQKFSSFYSGFKVKQENALAVNSSNVVFLSAFSDSSMWKMFSTSRSESKQAKKPTPASQPNLKLNVAAYAIPKAMPSSLFNAMNVQDSYKVVYNSNSMNAGEDAFFISEQIECFGVADGVGGWVEIGVDPSEMSRALMNECNRVADQFNSDGSEAKLDPEKILTEAYESVLKRKEVKAGSTTACVAAFSEGKLKVANLGDSGVIVLRPKKSSNEKKEDSSPASSKKPSYSIVHETTEQQHSFNAPFQLAVIPDDMKDSGWYDDKPSKADVYNFDLQEGDIIVCATDGLFDNVFNKDIAKGATTIASSYPEEEFSARFAKWLAFEARKIGSHPTCETPFGQRAEARGYYGFRGGKFDDVTVIACKVVKQE